MEMNNKFYNTVKEYEITVKINVALTVISYARVYFLINLRNIKFKISVYFPIHRDKKNEITMMKNRLCFHKSNMLLNILNISKLNNYQVKSLLSHYKNQRNNQKLKRKLNKRKLKKKEEITYEERIAYVIIIYI